MTTSDDQHDPMPASKTAENDGPGRVNTLPDTLSRRGAMALAKRLQDYWHARGHRSVRFWAEPLEERFAKVGSYEIYRVVCNLANGLPPR